MKRRIQFKLNERIFLVEVEDENKEYDELINDAMNKLGDQIQANNETTNKIFWEELEVVCSQCGISLTNGEEEDATICLQCEAERENFDKFYYIFINGKRSKYANTDKKDLEIELKNLLEHEDNKEWVKGKTFEIKKERGN